MVEINLSEAEYNGSWVLIFSNNIDVKHVLVLCASKRLTVKQQGEIEKYIKNKYSKKYRLNSLLDWLHHSTAKEIAEKYTCNPNKPEVFISYPKSVVKLIAKQE